MNFEITNEQKNMINEVECFFKNELNTDTEEFSKRNWLKCAELGLISMNVPSEYGGMDCDYLTCALLLETLGYACKDNGFIFAITNHLWVCQELIKVFGSDTSKQKYLSSMASGEKIGCFAITEADAGSDVFSMSTSAIKVDGGYLLNGNKMFISNAPIADVFIVIAKDVSKENSYIALIVDNNSSGFSVGKTIEKMGLTSCPMGEVIFNNVFVPTHNVLYYPGKGKKVADYALKTERIFEFASHIGVMRRITEQCIKYVNEREQFGKKIKEFQSVSSKIADMKVRYETAKLLLYKTAWLVDKGKNAFNFAAMLKLFVSEGYVKTCLDALQIHGAYGYTKEYSCEKDVRDALASTIYSGTSETMRNVIFSLTDLF